MATKVQILAQARGEEFVAEGLSRSLKRAVTSPTDRSISPPEEVEVDPSLS
ncbi:hypothetical protein [uncultured Porphyromonas sp.]|uniref:hypothetical protein n=1 Tax=uncultured Porphyromonas sp. TaxID=159274 RepID=UPI0026340F9B|nr:hypothetical protein [uncultured Porphyromonas sp.]